MNNIHNIHNLRKIKGKGDRFIKCGRFSKMFLLTNHAQRIYSACAVKKSATEPGNSNNLSLAHSTPKACFFMRDLHTPKERLARLSMVACSGKGFALCCVPVIAVFQPVTRYRPSLETLAVTLENLFTGVTQMYQFIFAAIRRTDLTNQIQKIRINADSETQARAILAREFVLILAGKINLKNDRTFTGVSYA
ncbi:host cell division inhibitor Icd-like protein [Necropsobacter rosorum]|uniref:host cell division inhibitor Icd-like protein n=1 Tax=Necropsobacter rosorum TaxID=908285 RepID=UPI003C7BD4A0